MTTGNHQAAGGFMRLAGASCIGGALLWIVALFMEYGFGLFPPGSGLVFRLNQSMFALAELGFVVGIAGLLHGGAAGTSWWGRLALGIFGLSWALLCVAQLAIVVTGARVFPPLVAFCWQLSMASGLVAGLAVALAQRWQTWQCYALLIYGIYVGLGVWLPRLLVDQQPALLTETIWGLAWLPVGLAIYARGATQGQPADLALSDERSW